jgi:DNA-binding CsgD family transcriptional regulator
MSRSVEAWLATWVDLVHSLLRQSMSPIPAGPLLTLMSETFDAIPAWQWVEADGSMRMEVAHPPAGWPPPDQLDFWMEVPWWEHPITSWFLQTGSLAPQTLGRVPATRGGRRHVDVLESQLKPFGIEQQLALPIMVGSCSSNVVISRTGRDFSDQQLTLARQIQPLLMLLDRQARESGPGSTEQRAAAAAHGLTGREVAVLRLLCEGLTADAIGRRLSCSPRTAQKHLEHIYRKLGVRDRLGAVRVAVADHLASLTPATGGGIQPPDEPAATPSEKDLLVVKGRLRPYLDRVTT